jgi:hypothetical protein
MCAGAYDSECAVMLERLGVVGLSKTGGSLYKLAM